MELHVRGRLAALALVVLAFLTIAGCGSKSSGTAQGQASQAHQVLQSATANPSVQALEARAKAEVINPCIAASNGPVTFKNCVVTKVPQAARTQVLRCMTKAAVNDHVTTEAGKQAWFNDSAACVGAVLPAQPASASPSPSPSASKS